MEDIYQVTKNELINLQEIYNKFQIELNCNNFPKTNKNIQNIMGYTERDSEFRALEDSISMAHLEQPDDVSVFKYIPGSRSQYRRKSVLEVPKKALRLNTFREMLRSKGKYSITSPYLNPVTKSNNVNLQFSNGIKDLIPYNDLIITVRVYKPFRYVEKSYGPKLAEEFDVLGSNYLTDLRDKISCLCNKKHLFDISEMPHKELSMPSVDPGFFFITDTFYNDTRNPNNPDYSAVIRKWASSKNSMKNIKFKTAQMENTKFIDLTLRIGFPQVYQHHGNCEHVFAISSIALLSSRDHLQKKDYPILKTISVSSAVPCNICANRAYSYVVKNSNRHLHEPAYLCQICFESYHYVDGEKIGDFQAYLVNPTDYVETINQDELSEDSMDCSSSIGAYEGDYLNLQAEIKPNLD